MWIGHEPGAASHGRVFLLATCGPSAVRPSRARGTAGTEKVWYLDVPQLLKHAIGLDRAAGSQSWALRSVYFAGPGFSHDARIGRFVAAVGDEHATTVPATLRCRVGNSHDSPMLLSFARP